jgi:hypothetical protein
VLPAVIVITIPKIHTKDVLVISEIDLARALIYLVIATPDALNKLEANILKIIAVNSTG